MALQNHAHKPSRASKFFTNPGGLVASRLPLIVSPRRRLHLLRDATKASFDFSRSAADEPAQATIVTVLEMEMTQRSVDDEATSELSNIYAKSQNAQRALQRRAANPIVCWGQSALNIE